ncbi:hypothetical protein [Rhodoblastus sp.]|jgi:hypothetical protein|uniref:hypothetical protein n=1 Tax=Rhodoblastus sp. TaxID=1962975 RepID=UPI003F9974B6
MIRPEFPLRGGFGPFATLSSNDRSLRNPAIHRADKDRSTPMVCGDGPSGLMGETREPFRAALRMGANA